MDPKSDKDMFLKYAQTSGKKDSLNKAELNTFIREQYPSLVKLKVASAGDFNATGSRKNRALDYVTEQNRIERKSWYYQNKAGEDKLMSVVDHNQDAEVDFDEFFVLLTAIRSLGAHRCAS